jgi:hypothetical protein
VAGPRGSRAPLSTDPRGRLPGRPTLRHCVTKACRTAAQRLLWVIGRVVRVRRTARAVGLLGLLPLIAAAACTGSTAAPPPFSESPAPSAAGSLVDPQPGPTATATATATATPTPTTTEPAATSSVTPTASAAPSTPSGSPATSAPAGAVALRTSYPGIKKLVIVKSRWNATPAGRAALNAVALYYGALATATTTGSIEPVRKLASPTCAQCQSDIDRIGGYIAAGQRLTTLGGQPTTWLSSSMFVSSLSPSGHAVVDFTSSEPAIKLTAANGSVLGKDAGTYIADEVSVDTRARTPAVEQVTRQ